MPQAKTYLITGASKGIGYEVALQLAARPGHRVLATARDGASLLELKEQALQLFADADIQVLPFDLGAISFDPLLDWVKAHGPLNGVLNNAGLLINKPFEALEATDWQSLFEVNVFAPARLLRVLADCFERPAHVVNIGSMGGYQGSSKFPGLSAYSASKAALSCLSECLAEEWKDNGVSVNCLALGAVQTEMLAQAFPGYKAPMESNEMAGFICWFLTEGHAFFNGKVLPVALNNP